MVAKPDDVLLNRARQFDLNALEEIYDSYSSGLYRYAMRLLGEKDLAEECVAETFSRLLLAFKGGGGPDAHLQAYLYRIAHNWITDRYRRQPPPALNLDEEVLDHSPNSHESNSDPILRHQIRTALIRLTPDQRQVILLKYIEGHNNDEIAQALQKPVSSVKSLQHRALCALRKSLLPIEE
jgi:RNA polymerase sigma-70 factor, ECF subfamily